MLRLVDTKGHAGFVVQHHMGWYVGDITKYNCEVKRGLGTLNSAIAMDAVGPKKSMNKRLFLIVIVTITVGFTFWMGSRVPNLNEKAMMGGDALFNVPRAAC